MSVNIHSVICTKKIIIFSCDLKLTCNNSIIILMQYLPKSASRSFSFRSTYILKMKEKSFVWGGGWKGDFCFTSSFRIIRILIIKLIELEGAGRIYEEPSFPYGYVDTPILPDRARWVLWYFLSPPDPCVRKSLYAKILRSNHIVTLCNQLFDHDGPCLGSSGWLLQC